MKTVKTEDKAKKVKLEDRAFRLVVSRSTKHTAVQLVDQESGRTALTVVDKGSGGTKTERARKVGIMVAKEALEKGFKKVTFDRNGRPYRGRVSAVAEGAREGGLSI